MKYSVPGALRALTRGLLAGAPLLAGCTVPSLYGFDDPAAYTFEPQWLGRWAQPGEPATEYRVTAGEENTYDVLIVETKEDGKEERLPLAVAMMDFGGHRVLDVSLARGALEEVTKHYGTLLLPTHQFYRLEPEEGGVRVHMLDDKWIRSWPGVLDMDNLPVLATGSPALLRILGAAVETKEAWDDSFVLEKKKDGR